MINIEKYIKLQFRRELFAPEPIHQLIAPTSSEDTEGIPLFEILHPQIDSDNFWQFPKSNCQKLFDIDA